MRCQKSLLWCHLTHGEEFLKIKPSGHNYYIKCLFSAHIMCMMHTPFKQNRVNLTPDYYHTHTQDSKKVLGFSKFAGKLH